MWENDLFQPRVFKIPKILGEKTGCQPLATNYIVPKAKFIAWVRCVLETKKCLQKDH